MPTECSAKPMGFARVDGRAVVADFDGGAITSNAGGLLLGATDRAIGLVERFAACFADGRAAERVVHEVVTLVGQRVFGIALGYEDLHRPRPAAPRPGAGGGARPAGGAARALRTARRQEHSQPARARRRGSRPLPPDRPRRCGGRGAVRGPLPRRPRRPPKEIVLDLDATDDPLHGQQEGRFFHGYYDCYCYLPLYVFCGGHLLAAKLRRADIDASRRRGRGGGAHRRPDPRPLAAGADHPSGDSGFAREPLMAWCEENRRRLPVRAGAQPAAGRAHPHRARLGRARRRGDRPAGPPLRRLPLDDERAGAAAGASSPRPSGCRAAAKGANPRFVVTSLKPADADARTLYEQLYCARGEMENRIKECQLDLFADRTSAATMRANQLRLWFASMAYVLVTALRRIGARRHRARHRHLRHDPPEAPEDRRPRHPQRPPRPHRHGLELPRRRRLPPRPRPIMRLTHTRPAQPETPTTNPHFDRAEAQRTAVPDHPSRPRTAA